jgi:hypothetical protein
MFLIHVNIQSFCFSPSKLFFLLLVSQKILINTFSLYFKINSCLDFIFFNEIFYEGLEYYNNLPQKI